MKNEIFDNMLSRYDLTTEQHKRNAIFEVNQQMILAGLYDGGFFESAAFYGGTCLRIFHGLQRFSEDMDFSLLAQDDKFDFTKYFPAIIDAFAMVGREVEIKKKDKKNFGKVESAFLKDNTDVYDVTFQTFCVASTIATILCGIGTLEVYGIGYKLFLAVETGIFITAGTLPLIVLVVFFSKTYVFSILLCVFYSVLNMSATALFDTLPKTMLWLLPTPLTTFWSAGDMAAHGIKMDLEQMTGLIPSTFQVVFILGIMAFVSFLLIDRLYKQRGE